MIIKRILVLLPVILLVLAIIAGSAAPLSGQADETRKKKKKIDDLFEMSFEELMKVKIITATKSPEKIGDIPASMVIVTRKDIQRYGYSTLSEILENIPGLYAIDDYSYQGANFGVRGFWSGVANDNIMILVNGVQQVYDPASSYPLATCFVPVEAIDRIDVVRGPMSVIYGSGAFFGVINIITDTTVDDSPSEPLSMVTASAGSERTRKLLVRLSGQEGKLHYVLNGAIYDTNGIDQPLSLMVNDPASLPNYNVPQDHRTGGRLEWNRKYFNFSGHFKDFHVDLGYNENKQELYFVLPSFDDGILNRLQSMRLLLAYKKKWSDKFTLETKFNYSTIRDWTKLDFLFEEFYGFQDTRSDAIEAEVNAFITPSGNLDITAGLYYRAVTDASNAYDLPSFGSPSLVNHYFYLEDGDDIVTQAFFTQATFTPSEKLKLVAGLRLEQMPAYRLSGYRAGGTEHFSFVTGTYDETKVEVIPRAAAIFTINSKNIVKLLYGKAINRSSFLQNQRNILASGRNALKPENIETFELNYIAAFSSSVSINTSIFRNVLRNLVTRVVMFDDNNNYESWSANAGKMITNGLELTLQIRPVHGVIIEANGMFQKTNDKRPGFGTIDVAYSPRFLGYIKASYEGNKLTAALTGTYVDAMETFWDETISNPDGSLGNRIGQPVPGYFNLAANLRLDNILAEGFYISLRLSNLLDEEIRYPTFTNNAWADRGTLGHGRTWLLSAGFKF